MSDMMARAQLIASALGEGWRAMEGFWGNGGDAQLLGPDDEQLHLREARSYSKRGRVEISGKLDDKHTEYNEPKHEITVSPDKSPVLVAGDITRRLLPGYREALAANRKRKEMSDAAEMQRVQAVSALMDALPKAKQFPHMPDTVDFGGGKHGGGVIGGEARVLYGGQVQWQITTNGMSTRQLTELVCQVASHTGTR